MPEQALETDQAAGLRTMKPLAPVRVTAITGGKGGVGKSTVSINLAVALAARGRRVMLLDADLGLANVDVLLGLQPLYNLSHVLRGTCSLEEVILTGPRDIRVVPAASGTAEMAGLTTREHAGLIHAFSELKCPVDDLLIDTAAGISDSVVRFSHAAHRTVVVVCDEPASITDAYALIKVMSRDHGVTSFKVLANMTRTAAEGQALFDKIDSVAGRFLDVTLDYIGQIPSDPAVRRAVQQQCAVVERFPTSVSAQGFESLARRVDQWSVPRESRGNLEFFVERMIVNPLQRRAV